MEKESTFVVINTLPHKVVKLKMPMRGYAWRIHQVAIPYTFYVVKDGTDTIQIDGVATVIRHGTYTPAQIVSELNAGTSKNWSYDNLSLKFTVDDAGAFVINYNSTTEGLLNILGFTSTQTLSGTNTYTGANVHNLNRPICIGLQIPELNSNVPVLSGEIDQFVIPHSNITIPIHIDVNYGDVIYYEGNQDLFRPLRGREMSLEIRIKDLDNGEDLDLNGQTMNVVIELLATHND